MSMPRAKRFKMRFSGQAHGTEQDLTWIDARSLSGALFAISAQIMRWIVLDPDT